MKTKILSFVLSLLVICALLCVTVFAEEVVSDSPRLIDQADLLSDGEEAKLSSKLDEYTKRHNVEIAIVTIDSLEGEDPKDVADALYDELNYGIGEERNGIMLLISMEDRDCAVRVFGDVALSAVGDSEYDSIMNSILPALQEDNYYTACDTFANECEYYINGEINGFPFKFARNLVIALAIGFIVAFIATSVMKGKLKSVQFQSQAANYVKAGSMDVTLSRDFFLYRNITRTARPKNNSSSSGRSSGGGRTYSSKF